MPRILHGTIAALVMLLGAAATPSAARADSWGCSAEKCLAVCHTAGGKHCSWYCDKRLREKQVSKVCK